MVVGGAVVVSTFALAQAEIFAPSAPSAPADTGAAGDAVRGEQVFESECAGCHGDGGTGGVGPALFETGLDAAEVAIVVQQGRGVMPAGIVTGQDQTDVVAYVVSISSPAS
jgi:mono/diheme cytochrome c family protein